MRLPRARQIGTALLIALTAAGPAAATSYLTRSYERFDTTEYVFYGEVTGYASLPPEPDCHADEIVVLKRCSPIWGVVLKVIDSVHMPQNVKAVELYSGELQAGCQNDDEACIRQTPVGSRLKVAAHAMEGETDTKRPILVARGWMREAVAPATPGQSAADRYHYVPAAFGDQFRNEADFELHKDLLRLERAKTENQALEVLLRLAGNQTLLSGSRDAFDALVERHLKSTRSRRALQQRLQLVSYWKDQQSEAALAAGGYVTAAFIQAQGNEGAESLRVLKELAGKSYHPAMLALALEYQKRDDTRQAADLFAQLRRATSSAESKRDASGLYLLSTFYQDGIGGLTANPEEARRLACLGRAAAQSDPRFPDLIVQWAEMRKICYGE